MASEGCKPTAEVRVGVSMNVEEEEEREGERACFFFRRLTGFFFLGLYFMACKRDNLRLAEFQWF